MAEEKRLLLKSLMRFIIPRLTNPSETTDGRRDRVEVAIWGWQECIDGNTWDNSAIEILQSSWEAFQSKEVTKEDMEKAESLNNEANQKMLYDKLIVAVSKYSEAISLNPRNEVYFHNRAVAYIRLGKYEESIADCNMAIKLKPYYAAAYARLGLAYSYLQRTEEAKHALDTAVEFEPSMNRVFYQRKYDRARRHHERNNVESYDLSDNPWFGNLENRTTEEPDVLFHYGDTDGSLSEDDNTPKPWRFNIDA